MLNLHAVSQVADIRMVSLGDGRELCLRHWIGPGDGVSVCLHGLLDSSEGWTRLCDGLGGTRIAIDLPGFGYSDPPARGSLSAYARDVTEAVDGLGIERFSVIGHSLGGAVGAALSDLIPERIASLVLLAPAGFGRIHLAEAVSLPGVRSLVATTLPLALSSGLAVSAGYMAMVSNGKAPEPGLVERLTSRAGCLAPGGAGSHPSGGRARSLAPGVSPSPPALRRAGPRGMG